MKLAVVILRLLSRRRRRRYGVTYYTSGRWHTIGRTFRTKRGAMRFLRLVHRNVRACAVVIEPRPRPRRGT